MKIYFVLLLFVGSSFSTDVEVQRLLDLMNENINEAANYTLPTDNSDFFPKWRVPPLIYGYYDYIIVGSGSAGSVLAYELSKKRSWRILLLEAGDDATEFSEIPGASVYLYNSRMNWGYYTIPQKTACLGMVNKQCPYVRGKVLGGSSSVNGMFYARGNRMDYEKWPGWSWEEIEESFKQIEKWQTDGDDGYHGFDGQINCNKTNPDGPYKTPYTEALESLGLREVDYNGKSQMGYSKSVYFIDFNKRVSGSNAYLKIYGKRLEILKKSYVTRVIIDRIFKTARGVEFMKNKRKYVAFAKREVILSAGAVNTPQILMLSGIGPKNELNKHNITLIKDLPVGENYIGHPLFFGLNVRTNVSRELGTMTENIQNYLNAATPLTVGLPSEIVSYNNLSGDPDGRPDVEFLMSESAGYGVSGKYMFNTNEEVNQYMEASKTNKDMTFFILLLHQKSRGSIRLKSSNPIDFPLIDPNLFSDPNNEDLEMVYSAVEYLFKILETEPMKRLNATILPPTTICQEHKENKEFWMCVIQHITMEGFHVTSTTRMGENETNSVVDKDLKVHGIKNLRVVDAGVIPESISGHISGPTFMLANRIARKIRQNQS